MATSSSSSSSSKSGWSAEDSMPHEGDYGEVTYQGSGIGFFGELRKVTSSNLGRVVVQEEVEDYGYDEESANSPERKLGWLTVSMIQIGDVVGIGILTMGAAFAQLGWVLSILLLLIMCPLNVYMGVCLSRAREIYPAALNYKEMSKLAVGRPWFTNTVVIFFYVYVIATLGAYILAMGQTLGEIFYNFESCDPVLSAIAVGILIFPMQLRTLSEAKPLMWINSFCIAFSVFICLGSMLASMPASGEVETEVIVEDLTWHDFINGFSKFFFAYLGAYIYLEIMSEMKEPTKFPKAFALSAPFQVTMYLFVGVVGYAHDGSNSADSIVKQLNPYTQGALLRVTCIALFIHLVASFLIKGTILCRSIHLAISPKTVNDNSYRGRLIWFSITLSIVTLCYIIGNSIPLFGKLTSILGGLAGPFLGFICPIVFLLSARAKNGYATSRPEYILLVSLFVFAFIFMFLSVAANFYSFIEALQDSVSKPFQCIPTSYSSHFEEM